MIRCTPCQKSVQHVEPTRAEVSTVRHRVPLTDDAVAAAPQAFDDDRLAPFCDINRAGQAARERPRQRAAKRLFAVGFRQNGARTGTEQGRGDTLPVELVLIAGEGATGRQIGLVCG